MLRPVKSTEQLLKNLGEQDLLETRIRAGLRDIRLSLFPNDP